MVDGKEQSSRLRFFLALFDFRNVWFYILKLKIIQADLDLEHVCDQCQHSWPLQDLYLIVVAYELQPSVH